MKLQQIKRSKSEFQQSVDESTLVADLSAVLRHEDITEIKELKAGFFNNTYQVKTGKQQYILKVAPVAEADVFYNEQYLMLRERSLSKTLQRVSDLIPAYLHFFKIGQRNAFIQPFIDGRLWHDVEEQLSEEENIQLWQQLGKFAKTIHSVKGNLFGYPDPFKRFKLWSEFIADNVAGMIEDAKRLGVYHQEIQDYEALLPHFFHDLDSVKTANLLHGDLWPRNVIIEGRGKDIHIKAVLDAERAFWGDPISDWVLIQYGVPDAFWNGYGQNIVESANPAVVQVYKGMYFLLNIIEATRFDESDEQARRCLVDVLRNLKELESCRQKAQ